MRDAGPSATFAGHAPRPPASGQLLAGGQARSWLFGLCDLFRTLLSWKETRFGAVEIMPGEARVHFCSEYDDDEPEPAQHLFETVVAETFTELL